MLTMIKLQHRHFGDERGIWGVPEIGFHVLSGDAAQGTAQGVDKA